MSNKPTVEQEKIIKALDTNVAVSAGAGSGKTQVLIGRFLHILATSLAQGPQADGKYKLNVDQIVAITFTKKAAAEMRTRLRQRLQEQVAGVAAAVEAGMLDSLTAKLYTHFWQEQLERLPRTHISTIHSLCSYILREHPLEANLDPQFTVAEEYQGKEFVQACLEQYLRQALQRQDEHVVTLVGTYGLQSFMTQVQLLLPELYALEQAGDLLQPYKKNLASLAQDKEALCNCLRELAEHPEQFQKPASSAYKQALATVQAEYVTLCGQIRQTPTDLHGVEAALTGVQARNDFKDIVNTIKELKATIAAKDMDAVALPLVEHWQTVLRALAQYVQERKQAADFLTFDDLETCTIALLKQFPEVRQQYQQRFRYLMVDEFQDTNDKQRQLIYLLCGNSAEHLEGQKLFVVGDPKQSIYRFRGADVSVFKRVQEEIVAGKGQFLSMQKNFRSRESVLKAVNAVFEPLLGTDTEQDVYFEALAADTERLAGGAAVELYTARYAKEKQHTKYQQEAELVAGKLLQLHSEGRPLSEMTILLRSTTHVGELVAALQKYNIPVALHSGSGFYEQQEVLDILNLLKALQNKYNNIALAGVLRSPYFGLDDETLTQLFVNGTSRSVAADIAEAAGYVAGQASKKKAGLHEQNCLWDSLMWADVSSFKAEQQPLVTRAQTLLAQLRQAASAYGLVELLQAMWQTLQVPGVLSQQTEGQVQLANVEKLRTLALNFVQEQQGTLASYLELVAKLRQYGTQETVATVTTQEAVQIMTYHGSKGLEFPVVLLPYLEAEEPNDTDSVLFLPSNSLHPERLWGLGIKVQQDYALQDTYLLQQLRAENRRYAFAERKRLLYVAFTRAEEQLVLFASGEEDKDYATDDWEQKNWFVQLESVLRDETALVHGDAEQLLAYLQPLAEQEQQIQMDVNSKMLQPLPDYDQLGLNYFSPSALQSYAHCQRSYYYHYGLSLPEVEVEREAKAGSNKLEATVLGHIVHSTLEYYKEPQYNAKELERCFKLALKEHLPNGGDATLAREMLENYLQSDLVPPLASAEKETNFTLDVADLTVTGFIDCMYENSDGTWNIVDYKSGRVPDVSEGKNAGYMYQLALYRFAVETLWRRQVKKCELHYLQGLKTVGLEDDAEYQKYLQVALDMCKTIGDKENAEEAFPCTRGQQCAYCGYGYMCK